MKYITLIISIILVPTLLCGIVQPDPYWEYEESTDDGFFWTIVFWAIVFFISYASFEDYLLVIGIPIVMVAVAWLLGKILNLIGFKDFIDGLPEGLQEWAVLGPVLLILIIVVVVTGSYKR